MKTRINIYELSQNILQSDNPQELLSSLPPSILQLIANQVPLEILPDDTEISLLNRVIEQQKKEYKAISFTPLKSIYSIIEEYKSFENKNDIEYLIKKNALLEEANLETVNLFNSRISILEDNSHGFNLNLEGTIYHGKLSRIPLSLIDKVIEINKTKPLLGINISENKLQIFPDAFTQCKEVNFINISNNQLKNLPTSFVKFINLETLYMDGNKFKTFPETICELKKISYLQMKNNPLQFIPSKINQLRSLENFYLDNCQLRTLPRELSQLNQLATLSLNSNRFAIYTFPEELKSILQSTRSYDGFGSNYNDLYHYFETPEFAPSRDFIDEFKKYKESELTKNLSLTLNHLNTLAKNICDKDFLIHSHQNLQALGLKHYKNNDYQSAAHIYKQLVDETKECEPVSLYNLASSLIKMNEPKNLIQARGYLVSACILSNNNSKYQKKLKECQHLIDHPIKKLSEEKLNLNSLFFNRSKEKSSEKPFEAYIESFKLNILKSTNPLFRAIAEKASLENIQKILFENKYLAKSVDSEESNALHIAALFNRPELVSILCNHGVDINQRNKVGYMPLHLSITAGFVEVMDIMLSHGADLSTRVPLRVPVF
jgi:Leucine-rich repeat (LRR) protein